MTIQYRYILLVAAVGLSALLVGSCAGGRQSEKREGAMTPLPLDNAMRLRMYEHADGWTEAVLINPWDTTKILQTVAMIPDSLDEIPSSVPSGSIVVRTPIKRSMVTTSMHLSLIGELGAEKQVAGVTDRSYIKLDFVDEGVENGTIIDCGTTMTPTIEKVISLSSDGILLSPYENGGDYGKLTRIGTPILFTADYMEPDPLGRAEWMKYYGRLFGKEREADSLFNVVSTSYNTLMQHADSIIAASGKGRPKVLLDLPYQGVWYVYGAASPNSSYINAAGADNAFAEAEKGATVPYAPERVIADAGDADVWLIRYNAGMPLTLAGMRSDSPMVAQFKAFNDGNVYGANTRRVKYYEEGPFHPDRILADIVEIIHPTGNYDLRYFEKIK